VYVTFLGVFLCAVSKDIFVSVVCVVSFKCVVCVYVVRCRHFV